MVFTKIPEDKLFREFPACQHLVDILSLLLMIEAMISTASDKINLSRPCKAIMTATSVFLIERMAIRKFAQYVLNFDNNHVAALLKFSPFSIKHFVESVVSHVLQVSLNLCKSSHVVLGNNQSYFLERKAPLMNTQDEKPYT